MPYLIMVYTIINYGVNVLIMEYTIINLFAPYGTP